MLETIRLFTKIYLWIIFICFILLIPKMVFLVIGLFKQKPYKEASVKHKFAIIIPARYESKVIRGALDSIARQTYDKDKIDTFVIVPDNLDPTIEILKEYDNCHLHVLDIKVTNKGDTMDNLFKMMIKDNSIDNYDAFFILDADNILEENCLYHINNAFDAGYDIVLAGRMNKNWKDGWVSNSSAITFSFINGINNKARTKLKANISISGSGLLVSKDIIKQNNGWPWHTLTEDYELSMVSYIKDYKSCYYELAKTYDEQPANLKVSKKQITRWLKGHSTVNKIYRKDMIKKMFATKDAKSKFFMFDFLFSLFIFAIIIPATLIYIISNIAMLLITLIKLKQFIWTPLINIGLTLVLSVLAFMIYSALAIISDRDNVRADTKSIIIGIIMSPIYFVRYLPAYIKCLFVKDIKWERIEHVNSNISNKD